MNTTIVSDTVRRITGTFIEDDTSPKSPLFTWIQAECRHGCFRKAMEESVKKQPEPLRPDLAIVKKVDAEKITLKIPARMMDHESPSNFETEVTFELNPVTLAMNRV